MPDDTLLSVKGLRSGYGASPALLGVDLDVGRREVVAVIGRNGVGKTTLMRTLCGLIAPSDGSIRFGGSDVTAEPADRRARGGLAYIPQGRDVFPTLTVRENLLVAEAARTAPGKPDYERVYRSFPVLKERERQSAGTLSGASSSNSPSPAR
jgi:ABC-type branched-subunit amino acid transport system ATPase component